MKINDTYEITRNDGVSVLFKNGSPFKCADAETLDKLYVRLLTLDTEKENREDVFAEFLRGTNFIVDEELPPEERIKRGIEQMISFFSEFNFTPSFRFLNSFAYAANKSNYVENYFALMGSPYAEDVKEKIKSVEWNNIEKIFADIRPSHIINRRFSVYYGAQGTGKTTKALEETDNLCIVCNASMLPSDLLEDFTFDDGKATFHPSVLVKCMEEGRAITLDEINLLPFDSLRFLQGVFDNKTEFQYKGNTIHIKDGFKVIGTMNLTVNGVAFGLPEPLVDRCFSITEFELTPEVLMGAF